MPSSTSLSRRRFIKFSSSSLLAASIDSAIPFQQDASITGSGVIAGAIRWDAWYERAGSSIAAQHSLSSVRYYSRAPFWCTLAANSLVSCTGTTEEMDKEIHLAVKGGLKYWAFDWYSPDSSLRVAWNLYQQSQYRYLINWCGLVGLGLLGSSPFSNNQWKENMLEWAGYMKQTNYQKVTVGVINRPLLYILWDQRQLQSYFDNDVSNLRTTIEYLKQLLSDDGLPPPYVVILHATTGAQVARTIGGAISSYISGFKAEIAGSYRDLAMQTLAFWKEMMSTGDEIIPIAMVGWDTRARQERPVPWEHEIPNPHPSQYYALATPTELASHLRAAVDFIRAHPNACPSKVLLIYSWDECDEGGAIVPTLGDPTGSYLKAIAPIIS